jgi:hypothetical protein
MGVSRQILKELVSYSIQRVHSVKSRSQKSNCSQLKTIPLFAGH